METAGKIFGGPERKAFEHEKVETVNFSENDPFWDISARFIEIEKEIREGDIEDVVIMCRGKGNTSMVWRGSSPLTTALGMLRIAEIDLIKESGRE